MHASRRVAMTWMVGELQTQARGDAGMLGWRVRAAEKKYEAVHDEDGMHVRAHRWFFCIDAELLGTSGISTIAG